MKQKIVFLAESSVAYVPTLLCSMKAICKTFCVSKERVREWVQQGAPILVEGEGRTMRYTTEVAKLMAWREVYAKRHRNTKKIENTDP